MTEKHGLVAHGQYSIGLYRKGKLLQRVILPNAVTNDGLDYLLDQMFISLSAPGGWYIGLIDIESFSSLNNADTMSSHAGWIELADYDETSRPTWAPSSIGARTILNGTQAEFTMNASRVIKGIFVTSDATKSGTSGYLWSTALVTPSLTVAAADVVKITYQLTADRG